MRRLAISREKVTDSRDRTKSWLPHAQFATHDAAAEEEEFNSDKVPDRQNG
jgi:hypothetical protein